jgi:hypothetical protein
MSLDSTVAKATVQGMNQQSQSTYLKQNCFLNFSSLIRSPIYEGKYFAALVLRKQT